MVSPSIVWLRDDLRLADNPALRAAVDAGGPVVVLYVLDEESPGIRPLGGAARWWLHHSLASLADRLEEKGARLVLRRGPAGRAVREAVTDAGARAVYWNRRYGGAEREIDTELKSRAAGGRRARRVVCGVAAVRAVDGHDGRGHALLGVHAVLARVPERARSPARPLPEPREIAGWEGADLERHARGLGPRCRGIRTGQRVCARRWEPGEPAARRRLREFLDDDLDGLRAHARRAGRRVDVAPLAAPALGRAEPAHRVARGRRGGRRRPLPVGARLARVRVAHALPLPRSRDEEPAPRVRRLSVAAAAPRRSSRPGSTVAPASRSSTPACASSGGRASCTTACGWSRHPSSSRTS